MTQSPQSQPPKPPPALMVWVDMEMSGLEPERDVILEIATVLTDGNLNIIAEGPELVIHQEPQLFDLMDDWNKEHHSKSGLWSQVIASKVTVEEAEKLTMDFLKKHTPAKASPLCGNSVHQDRRFIVKYMADLDRYLHYRLVDVSTVKELVSRWYPESFKFHKKDSSHRAKDDIIESINEMKHYRNMAFKPQ